MAKGLSEAVQTAHLHWVAQIPNLVAAVAAVAAVLLVVDVADVVTGTAVQVGQMRTAQSSWNPL